MPDLHLYLLLAIVDQQSGLARTSKKFHRLHYERTFFLAQYIHENLLSRFVG